MGGSTINDCRRSMSNADLARTFIEDGYRHRENGDRASSLSAFTEAVELDPSNVAALLACAYDCLHLTHILRAREMFERALAHQPENKDALIGLGHAFRHLKRLEDAEGQFRRVLSLEPGHAGASVGLAHTLRSLNRFEEALEAFRQAARTKPDFSIYTEIAYLLRDLDRPNEAIDAIRQAQALEPADKTLAAPLARLLKRTGRIHESLALMQEAVESDSGNVALRIELGNLLRDADRSDDALLALNGALSVSPDNLAALNAIAYLHLDNRQLDLAAHSFQRVLELQPNNGRALHGLGQLARRRGNHEECLEFFERVRHHDPGNMDVRIDVGFSLRNLGRFDEAAKEFETVIAHVPNSLPGHMGLGFALREAGRKEAALKAFDEALAIDEKRPDAAIDAGYLLLQLGRPQEAGERFKKALARSSENLAALVGLSHASRRTGEPVEAEQALRKALAIQPDDAGALTALGHLLADQCRLDEAVSMFAALLGQQAASPDILTALANVHRRRGDRLAAREAFQEAAAADPHNPKRLIEVAVELRELGQFDEANAILESVLVEIPNDSAALTQKALIFRKQHRRAEALAAFERILELNPDLPQVMAEAAIEEQALGRPGKAKQWLTQALSCEENHLGALLQLGEMAVQEDDLEKAKLIYQQVTLAHPNNPWGWLGGARASFASGQREDAFRMLSEARAKLGPLPEIAAIEVQLLRDTRDWSAASKILDDTLQQRPNFWLWTHKVQIAIATGDYEAASTALEASPASSTSEHARSALLRGLLAEAQFRYDEAINAYKESMRLDPGEPWPHFELSRAALMDLDTFTAREALKNFVLLWRSSLLLKGQSPNLSQNHVGQLLDEFLLDPDALVSLRRARLHPIHAQFELLRKLVLETPDYTPAAIIALIALRQGGQLQKSTEDLQDTSSPIPRRIFQFWDQAPPDDVRELMQSWQDLNPGYEWTCFDDEQADDLLRREFGADIRNAYSRTSIPAQKADLFRLACLVARGGIYADADDKCLSPIESFVLPGMTLVVHQENYGSIGNNFIAATPEHPVLTRALELAAAAINRGDADLVWLSTGPGLLTRAFALEWAAPRPGGILRRTQVLELGTLQRVIGVHCPVRYKSTRLHWSRSSFGRNEKRVS
jgi:tetratricopeptide (TPR) repeat protein